VPDTFIRPEFLGPAGLAAPPETALEFGPVAKGVAHVAEEGTAPNGNALDNALPLLCQGLLTVCHGSASLPPRSGPGQEVQRLQVEAEGPWGGMPIAGPRCGLSRSGLRDAKQGLVARLAGCGGPQGRNLGHRVPRRQHQG
jgi:hypothetical protein